MPNALIPKDKEISEEIILLRRMVQMLFHKLDYRNGTT